MALVQDKQKEMEANSAAWHKADPAEQARLHERNTQLQKEIDGLNKTTTTFDPNTGTWGSGTSSSGGNTTTSPPTQEVQGAAERGPFQGSATGVQVSTSEQQKMKDEMNANSQAWHSASPEERARLEQANRDLAAQLGGTVGFDSGSGTWSGTAAGQVPSGGGVNDYSSYIEEMNRQKQKAALDALRAAYDKNVAGLDRAQAAIAPEYQGARNDAAGQAELQKKNFAEYAAANGLNSGAGGQAQLAFGNALQKNLSDISEKEASSMADLELQRSQMETDFNSAIAQAEAQGNYELAQQLYQEKVRQDEAYRQQMQFQAQQDLQNQVFQFNKDQANIANGQWDKNFGADSAQNDKTWALKMAQEMAQYGNFDGYKALGYSDEQISTMKSYWDKLQQQSVRPTGNGGGGGYSGPSKPALTYAQMMDAIENGNLTPNALSAYEYYMGTPYEEKQYGAADGAGLSDRGFAELMTQVQNLIRAGRQDDAAKMFRENMDKLSEEQISKAESVLG